MARPPSPKYDIDFMIDKIENYIQDKLENDDILILKEVCAFNNWNYEYIMELQLNNKLLSESIKRLLYLKETWLERKMTKGESPSAACIFSLKQLGWRDRQEDDSSESSIRVIEGLLRSSKKIQENKEKKAKK